MKHVFKSIIVALLTYEAKILLRRAKPTIIAITGSVGKTSTKDAIFSVLSAHRKTRKSEKSFNSEIGVPLSILGLPNGWNNPFLWLKNIAEGFFIAFFSRDYPEILVLEAGVDRPGDMKRLATWLSPDIIVMTRLPDVPAHVEYFPSPEAVATEKLELLKALRDDGVFIYNHDDPKLQAAANDVRQPSFGFGRYAPTHFMAQNDGIVYHDDLPVGASFDLVHFDERVPVKIYGTIGVPNAYVFAATAAVASQFDIPLETVAAALGTHLPPPGRMRVLPGLKSACIIDDTYNSSPIAVEAALTSLRELRGFKRKIVVLGDMLELGQYSSREHERLGALVPGAADMLLTIGIRSRKIAEGALEHGLHESKILQYDDAKTAGRELQGIIAPGDVILIKGSQGVRAERVVEEIMAEPEKASTLLVRQDNDWQQR
jgi:UDP-N-acetylmuramoyl-tripeptide--D-alanyl-D-alanine ligase